MKNIHDIVYALKNGHNISVKEIKVACLVQDEIINSYINDVKNLLKGGISAEDVKQTNYSRSGQPGIINGISNQYIYAMGIMPKQMSGNEKDCLTHDTLVKIMNGEDMESKDDLWKLSVKECHKTPPCINGETLCNCNYNGKCIRKDNHSNIIGVCWMERGQGEY